MAPSFLTRMRNGSHSFTKDQSSVSTLSLPIQQDVPAAQRPVETVAAPITSPPDAPLAQQVQEMGRNELQNHENAPQSVNRPQGLSLRKRFFSRSGAPMATIPRPMSIPSCEDTESIDVKEHPNAMMLPDGKIDMVTILQAIEQKYVVIDPQGILYLLI